MFKDPVLAADGLTYERCAIYAWLSQNSNSPVTGQPLPHLRVVDNVLIKNAIAHHTQLQVLRLQ